MSQTHLLDLRRALEQYGWTISDELGGNDYDISGSWLVTRSDESATLHIDFEGLDDLETLPMDKAYACRIRENPKLGAYFARKNRSWPSELAKFIRELNKSFSGYHE